MNKTTVVTYGIALVMALAAVSVGTLYLAKNMWMQAPPKIATINVESIIEQMKAVNREKLEKASKKEQVQFDRVRQQVMNDTVAFAQNFEQAVNAVSEQCHCVLLKDDVILSGKVKDLTDDVVKQMSRPVTQAQASS